MTDAGLQRFQAAVAALCMDQAARLAWRQDPDAFARQAGLRGRDAKRLAALPFADVDYYARRRWVDRWSFLAADLPQATRAARAADVLEPYFRAVPYPFEDTTRESERFATWLRQARTGRFGATLAEAVPCALPDVAAYEAGVARLWLERPPEAQRQGARTAAGWTPRLRRSVRLLRLGHDFAGVLDTRGMLAAPHTPSAMALVRRPHRVEPIGMDPLDHAVAAACNGRRDVPAVTAHVRALADGDPRFGKPSVAAVRAALRALVEAGIVG